MAKAKIVLSWSGGKDCSLALYYLLNNKNYEVVALLTSVTKDYDRISMHGVSVKLLKQQAKVLNLPVHKIVIRAKDDIGAYEKKMRAVLSKLKQQGITTVAFGDIFLEDLKQYRIQQLAKVNFKAVFPLWGKNTKALAHKFLDLGFQAITTCVDIRKLTSAFVGHYLNEDFLQKLPATVDPCGENGEFHSFVTAGPIFSKPLDITIGDKVLRDDFCFCDIRS